MHYINSEEAKRNQYRGAETNTTYKAQNGYTIELPRYHKDKMYTEEQKRELWTKTLNENNVYISGIKYNKENQDDTDYRKIFYNTLKTTRESNEKTINYITKYITKLDNFHKGYKQKIITSKKIGQTFIPYILATIFGIIRIMVTAVSCFMITFRLFEIIEAKASIIPV